MKFLTEYGDIEFTPDYCFVAGWTGRDTQALNQHIEELGELGVARPSSTPLYYRVSNTLITHDSTIEVLGNSTSGEVEPLLLQLDGDLWIGLASDHTDRKLETHSVAASKQICPKPVAQLLWKFDDVKDHIDTLIIRCSIKEHGNWISYQEGTLSSIRPFTELMKGSGFGDNCAMLCGTLPAIGGVRTATEYKMEMHDPVQNKDIYLYYQISTVPIIE